MSKSLPLKRDYNSLLKNSIHDSLIMQTQFHDSYN